VAPIEPDDAVVQVVIAGTETPIGSYDPENKRVCVYTDTGGTYHVTIIAEAECSTASHTFTIEVTEAESPVIVCPDPLDTLMCLIEPTELCVSGVQVSGTGVQVNVFVNGSPSGDYSAGTVCIPVAEAGSYDVMLVATGTCGADTCTFNVGVEENQSPTLHLPQTLTFERCPDDEEEICIDGIFATDPDTDVLITQVICAGATDKVGTFTNVTPDSGVLCFIPDTFGVYEFCFEASDGCHTVDGSFTVNVNLKPDCDVCLRLSIDGGECVPVGRRHTATLNIETNNSIGGFDVLLYYDPSLAFINASIEGSDIEAWEFFTYTVLPNQQVRLVGIADQNNGAAHPPDSAYDPNGIMVFLEFQITPDQNIGGQPLPIEFRWFDCPDNTFSDPTGEILFVDSRIYNYLGALIWDEFDDVNFPEEDRFRGSGRGYYGTPDDCLTGGDKGQPLRCAEFYEGAICTLHPDSIDDRGDVNLNGIAYEIADAVVFTNYFIRGLSAFTISVEGQIAATDVNADGIPLTVADLTYLIRVVIGDAEPVPRPIYAVEDAVVVSTANDGVVSVQTDTKGDIGAAFLIYDFDPNVEIGTPVLAPDAASMSMGWSIHEGQLRILIYDVGTERISSGVRDLIEIPYFGDGALELVHVDLADYYGRPYGTDVGAQTPDDFTLRQNYPNPFNPTTTICFMLSQPADWTLSIYNVEGRLVRRYEGSQESGTVEVVWDGQNEAGQTTASGVYLYRLEAGAFSDTRKMILLK
jgi:hypothetical protein